MIGYTPNSRCQPASSDFWHQPSLNTFHCAAFSPLSLLPVSVISPFRSLSLSFICFPPPLCSSSAIGLTAEADSGMEGIGWVQLEKLHSFFAVLLWTLPLSSCLFYSNTLKQKDWWWRNLSTASELVQQHFISKAPPIEWRKHHGFSFVLRKDLFKKQKPQNNLLYFIWPMPAVYNWTQHLLSDSLGSLRSFLCEITTFEFGHTRQQ